MGGESMAFTACDMVYDGTSSSMWDLVLVSMNSSGEDQSDNVEFELMTTRAHGSSKNNLYGVNQNNVLKYQLKLMRINNKYIDRFTVNEIVSWLASLGSTEYKKLFLKQKDMYDTYYNCKITSIKNVSYNGKVYGFVIEIECDSQYAWQTERTKKFGSITGIKNITFVNKSADINDLYPKFKITMGKNGGDFYIKNLSNNGYTMSFSELLAGEVLEIDCERNVVSSGTGLRRMNNFNKNFLMLVNGVNELEISGDIASLDMTYQFAKAVGV